MCSMNVIGRVAAFYLVNVTLYMEQLKYKYRYGQSHQSVFYSM